MRFVNRSPNPTTDNIVIMIDSDRNRSTGSPGWDGAEYLIGWMGGTASYQWDGAKWVAAPSMTTLISLVGTNELTMKMNQSELGHIASFDFGIESQNWADPNAESPIAWDDAPDYGHGLWSYDVKLYVAPVLSASAIKCAPDPPKSGNPMVASTNVTVMRGTTPEALGSTAKVTGTGDDRR